MEWISHWKNNLYIDLYRLLLLSNSLHTETISEWIFQKTGWMETVNFIHKLQLWSILKAQHQFCFIKSRRVLDKKKTFLVFLQLKTSFCPKFCYVYHRHFLMLKNENETVERHDQILNVKLTIFNKTKNITFNHLLFLDKNQT